MASFGQGVLVPGVAVLHRQGPAFSTVPSSFLALNSQEYYNLIVYKDVMYPYYGNIYPHRIPRGGGDYPSFNGNNTRIARRSPSHLSWVQCEVTLILDGHGESNVTTRRHGDQSMEAMIAKKLKTKSCWKVLAKAEDGVPKICTVCQEDLCREEEEEIGVLDCRHEYHACCIKKNWLVRKNVCPLCNATAVKVD